MMKCYLNGFLFSLLCLWSTLSLASSDPQALAGRRYIGVTIFNFEDDPRIDDERIEHSAGAGCNAVEITINWDKVYPTRTSTPKWSVVDSHVQTALRMGLKVALRIHVGRDLSRLGGFWGTNETMKAADGSIMTGGIAQFSYAHQPTVDLSKAFVREVTQRYRYLQQQGHLLFVSVVASPALESEYSPVHHKPDGSKYIVPFDYSDPMQAAFRQWLQSRFSLTTLNQRWGTGYGSWNEIDPPTGNLSDPHSLFTSSIQGKDWYVFRHRLLERYLNEITGTIKGIDGGIRVVNQHGCVWDRLSGLRSTYAFKSLNQNSDGLKFNDGPTYNHRFSMDLVRSNLKPGAFMINAVDGMFHQSVSVETYYQQVLQCYQHGASMITLANFGGDNARDVLTQIIDRVVDAGLLNQPVTQVQTVGSITYKLSEILKDFYAPISTRWGKAYEASGGKPVQVTLIEDWLDETSAPANPVTTPPSDDNQAPRISIQIPDLTATVGQPFSYTISESNFKDADGTVARVDITGLPAGLTYSADRNRISGTPTTATTATVTVKATDNDGATITDSFRLTVRTASASAPPPADPTEPANFEGFLDKAECESIRGWVWDRNRPNTPLTVEFYEGSTLLGSSTAANYRSDLEDAGKGDGRHGYIFPTPDRLKDGRTHSITAKVQGTSYVLRNSPKSLICSSSARIAAASVGNPEESGPAGVWQVYPNPFREQINLRIPADREPSAVPYGFTLLSPSGRQWPIARQAVRIEAGAATIDISALQLPAGLYLLQVSRGDVTMKAIKVLKQ
ncbi:putative Ig domain-containing protein [Larkinella soli]|uniref:putative Ig domain-containing protein n=1 Tax=Larkinella soli TaxID=1770527 RepID=UPI0013E2CFA3|nr:putative Ig domain-containing protein [Larkinella soli]